MKLEGGESFATGNSHGQNYRKIKVGIHFVGFLRKCIESGVKCASKKSERY